ncbi:endonuclease/exonuclease/phosphatase family protein [Parabacteroides provencensis]|uniref:endonuclease/exonuclease/phosphatase family protein n=1 Tax=Parabacteroides provencensis TaxID=1944636 RepID=UPI000C147DCA|nr:endonuclease/exonuclease/phosphatase family protein [Parabacteroides provencensis]
MKKLVYILFVIVTLFAALLAMAGFASGYIHPEGQEWIAFPGLILLPVLVVNLIIGLIWWIMDGRWGWLSAFVLLLNLGFIFSMFQFHVKLDTKKQTDRDIKIITYNVDNFHLGGINTFGEIIDWVNKERPDIVCFQECPGNYFMPEDSLSKTFSFLPYFCSTAEVSSTSGLAVFSRYPILSYEPIIYPGSNNKSMKVTLDIQGDTVQLFTNHLQTTSVNSIKPRLYQAKESMNSQEGTEAAFQLAFQMKKNFVLRAMQADFVRQLIDNSTGDIIVCGDFNDTPASYVYNHIKGNLTDGFRDSGSGFGYTFRELKRIFRIDYIFYSGSFEGLRYDSPNLPWSDHKPVVCMIRKKIL